MEGQGHRGQGHRQFLRRMFVAHRFMCPHITCRGEIARRGCCSKCGYIPHLPALLGSSAFRALKRILRAAVVSVRVMQIARDCNHEALARLPAALQVVESFPVDIQLKMLYLARIRIHQIPPTIRGY